MGIGAMQDPFAQADEPETFVRPNPGAWTAEPRARAGRGSADDHAEPPLATDGGLNPLVGLANPLLLLAPQLRSTRRVDDVVALRNLLAQSVRDFATRAAAAGIAPERVIAARYVLCTMLDEAAAASPWGGSGQWAQHSLLAMFHNEAWGGEKVFQLMARLAERPRDNLDLLELVYAVLALGFEGRYRVLDNGQAQLEAVRDRLAQIIRKERGDHPAALAEHWQVEPRPARAMLGWLPLAAAGALTALALAGIHLGYAASLGGLSDPVYRQVLDLRLTPPVPAAAMPAAKPRLAQFLQSDVKAGNVEVRDEIDRSVVVLRGDGLFAPASATLFPERIALMNRIADALTQMPGAVLVTGYTDSTPIRTARFPSNWHLSEERARAVSALLAEHHVAAERLRPEGRADAEPVAANDTPANRALNRRVEITLIAPRGNDADAAARSAAASGVRR
ncbi:MAG: DotU family type VI secretion system protein [Proteobacteria bacterium]|nr:DotU family type VI secretion system protein [Pseudomonadota bacterium]